MTPACYANIVYKTAWAMPSRWTFGIPPIGEFVSRHIEGRNVIVDPFAGKSTIGTHRNDISQTKVHSSEWLDGLIEQQVRADAVLFDPPYSPRQISECYKEAGLACGMKDTQNSVLYADIRKRLDALLRPGGVALSFGWQSSGFGKHYVTTEILLVQHGGAHNDTICVAQRKPITQPLWSNP
jgi:hypothetical protein